MHAHHFTNVGLILNKIRNKQLCIHYIINTASIYLLNNSKTKQIGTKKLKTIRMSFHGKWWQFWRQANCRHKVRSVNNPTYFKCLFKFLFVTFWFYLTVCFQAFTSYFCLQNRDYNHATAINRLIYVCLKLSYRNF